ncbi:NAD(+)/NADH kinase [candidate division KSB1 bacterium]|nr:NAD(+)/NADH kinase [candidate division KSB1 bacterium]
MKVGIVANTHKPKALSVIKSFTELLQQRHIPIIYADDLQRFLSLSANEETASIGTIGHNCTVVVAFGGDGTILATAKHVGSTGVPILGVNIGTLGFLAEVTVDELEETIDDLLQKKYAIVERMVFKIDIERDYLTKTYFALNDVVLDKGLSSRLIFIDARVNGVFLNSYRADGLIIATPTGSTAYSMSAGGPLVVPDLHAFIVTPICPHSLTVRPIVLSDDAVVELSIRKEAEPVQVNIDGQNRYKLLFNEKVRISKSDYNVRWISIGKGDFFHILRTKLNWGVNHKGVN